jgi:signal peptidase II
LLQNKLATANSTDYKQQLLKKIHIAIIVTLVILADQVLKIYVKTTFPLNTSHAMAGNWFKLYFVENPGMAYGWKWGGNFGKLALTTFRLIAVVFGTFYLGTIVKKGYNKGFIICASLIYAGALGNLIDSCFYGIIFDKGMVYNAALNDYMNYSGLATFSKNGYTSFLHGNVVDMLHFPIIQTTLPSWVPFWGGQPFEFFSPIFNIADAAISTGIISLVLFQKRLFKQTNNEQKQPIIETTSLIDDQSQVS